MEWLFCVYACGCFVRRSRAYKACICVFFVIFRPLGRFYGLSHALCHSFCHHFSWFLWQKPLLRAYIFMSFDCSYFPLFLPLVSKITGVRPEKCSKSRIFYVEAPTKGFGRGWWFWWQTKNGNLMQIWAYICGCKTRICAYKVLSGL